MFEKQKGFDKQYEDYVYQQMKANLFLNLMKTHNSAHKKTESDVSPTAVTSYTSPQTTQ